MSDKNKNQGFQQPTVRQASPHEEQNGRVQNAAPHEQSDAAKEVDARFSEPVRNDNVLDQRRKEANVFDHPSLSDEEIKEMTPAPIGGAEGSNFKGGKDGKENPPLPGREDYRGNSAQGKEIAKKMGMPETQKPEGK